MTIIYNSQFQAATGLLKARVKPDIPGEEISVVTGNPIPAPGSSGAQVFEGSPTEHALVVGTGTRLKSMAVAANGQIPIGSAGADPVLAAILGTVNEILVTNGAGSITLSLLRNYEVHASGDTLAAADMKMWHIFDCSASDAVVYLPQGSAVTRMDWVIVSALRSITPTPTKIRILRSGSDTIIDDAGYKIVNEEFDRPFTTIGFQLIETDRWMPMFISSFGSWDLY